MASSIARPFLRGAAYRQLSFVLSARHRHTLCYSYLTASSSPYSSLVQSTLIQKLQKTSSSLFLRFASSKVGGADENLLKVLQSEISCIQEFKEPRVLEVPEGFPFEIIDNPGDNTITLKREFAGESIQAIVYMNPDEEEEDEDEDTDQENEFKPSISLLVTIDKGDSPILEFSCSLNSDELLIESMARRNHDDSDGQGAYQGPAFSDLEESLRKGLHKYLKVRGIRDSLYGFLYEYMMIKDEREYRTWLKNIHEFVRK